MSRTKTVYTEVEVDIDISDFETEDLLDELESRGSLPLAEHGDAKEIVEAIWMKRRLGKDYLRDLDELIYSVTGRIV